MQGCPCRRRKGKKASVCVRVSVMRTYVCCVYARFSMEEEEGKEGVYVCLLLMRTYVH